MGVGGFEWSAVFCLVPLIVIFLPFYLRNKIFTVPEFLERRFDRRVRLFFSSFMILLSVLTKISISLWASALVFEQLLGWNHFAVIWGIGIVTALYTMKGGLRAVVYTDALQTTVLIIAAITLVTLGLHKVGGWSALHEKLAPEMFSMVPVGDRSELSVARHVVRGLHRGMLLLVDGPGAGAADFCREGPRSS